MSLQFNGALAQQVAALRAASPGLNLYLLDVGGIHGGNSANPAAFGFTNVTDACFNDLSPTPTAVRVAGHLLLLGLVPPDRDDQQPALPTRGEAAS